ncbi:MAG: hypothetical protein H0U44_01365 [Flavisolibacter sp.]|jgi:hypothetical protein|nr:hypothetical protein [Flavisolibacter sp.]
MPEDVNRPLTPSFIKKFDRKLLLNHPNAWSTRTHLVVYYGLLFILLLGFISYIVPDDPRTDSTLGSWVGFVSLLSLIGLVAWLIYLLRFNVFKRFGISKATDTLLSFFLYFISIAVFVFFPYVKPIVETMRANKAYTSGELAADINAMNMAIVQLEYDSLNHSWTRDTTRIVQGIGSTHTPVVERTHVYDTIVQYPSRRYSILYSSDLDNKMRNSDSLQKINDSTYIFFTAPNYTPLTSYSYSANPVEALTSREIYNRVIRNFQRRDKNALTAETERVSEKYVVPGLQLFEYYDVAVNEYQYRLSKRYQLERVRASIENIMDRKSNFDADRLPGLIRVHFYLSLSICLLLFAFRHSTPKAFFFSILAAVILLILTMLISAFSGYAARNLNNWVIFYFFLFFILSVVVFKTNRGYLVTGIAVNLFFYLLPFVPLCMVASYYHGYLISNYELYYENYGRDLLIAEVCGILLLLVMLLTYVHSVYRKWYALPEA